MNDKGLFGIIMIIAVLIIFGAGIYVGVKYLGGNSNNSNSNPLTPPEPPLIGGCPGVSLEYRQQCCDNWASENEIVHAQCVGNWTIENNLCKWECSEGNLQ